MQTHIPQLHGQVGSMYSVLQPLAIRRTSTDYVCRTCSKL